MSFLISVVVLAAVVALFMLVERLYRSPTKPKWIDGETVVMVICVAFTGAFAAAVGAVIGTGLALPLGLWGDFAVSLAMVVAIVLAVRFAFRLAGGSARVPAV